MTRNTRIGADAPAYLSLFLKSVPMGAKRFFGGDPEGGFLGTSLTPKEFFEAASDGALKGAMTYADRLLPFYDPYADAGYYDPLVPTLQASQLIGAVGQQALYTGASAGVVPRTLQGP